MNLMTSRRLILTSDVTTVISNWEWWEQHEPPSLSELHGRRHYGSAYH